MKPKKKQKGQTTWLYRLVMRIGAPFYRLAFRFVTDSSETDRLEGPFLAIANHQCRYDFISVAMALRKHPLRFLASSYYFRGKFLSALLRRFGCIPIKQFFTDTAAVRNLRRAVARGENVCVFPEGQIGYFGRSLEIGSNIAKLVKLLRVPVVNVKLRGGFLTYPKWSRVKAPARMEAKTELLLTAEDVRCMSEEEISKALAKGLQYDEFDWQRERMIPCKKGRTIKGLEKLLSYCPHCKTPFAMRFQDESIRCDRCGYQVLYDAYGFLRRPDGEAPVTDSIADWYHLQCAWVRDQMNKGAAWEPVPAKLYRSKTKGDPFLECGEGVITVNPDGLFFEGICDKQPFSWLFSVREQDGFGHSVGPWRMDDLEKGEEGFELVPEQAERLPILLEIFAVLRAQAKENPQVLPRAKTDFSESSAMPIA